MQMLADGHPANQMMLHADDIGPALVGLLKRHVRIDAESVTHACAAIETLRGAEDARLQLLAEGTVPLLTEAIAAHPSEPALAQKALEAIAYLHREHADMLAAARSNVFRVLVAAMQRHRKQEGVVGAGLSLIAKATASAEPRAVLAAAGAPVATVTALRGFQGHRIMVQFGTIAFALLCAQDAMPPGEFKKAVAAGAIPALVPALRWHTAVKQTVQAAVKGLRCITQFPEYRSALLAEGVVAFLVTALKGHADDQQPAGRRRESASE